MNHMNLLPKSKEEFSEKAYWDAFFKKRGNKAFEWYGEYPELSSYLHKYLKKQDAVLILGCGNSTLGRDLYDVGCQNVTNIDISNVVIKQMLSQNDKERTNLKYIQMDALNTSFKNDEFTVIIDKGTLDALMPNDKEETVLKINKYFSEVQRVLKSNGRYICISLLQEHILKQLLDYFPSNSWMFRAVRCFESEQKSIENGENPMPVFMVVCTKFKMLTRQILEINLGIQDKMQKCLSTDEVIAQIASAQRAAFVCSALKKSKIGDDNEIELEVFTQINQANPRYSIFVVEVTPEPKNASYAAFIVPEGRESEWLFSTKAGRKNLVKVTNHNRLTIVTLNREHKYESIDTVKKELEDIVCNLAPANLDVQKIPFLTLGPDIGKRVVVHRGTSYFSGDYVIEDVERDDEVFRRLFYLSSQLVIQSEAKIKSIRVRGGKTSKAVVDLTTLTCQHHIYMSIAACLVAQDKENADIVVLGLGGGGLCSFLHKFLPKATVTGVDIEAEMLKIATQWFDFYPRDKLRAKIQDGLDYLRQSHKEGSTIDVILCDVDSKNTDIGMSCPPKEFLSDEILEIVSKLVRCNGVFVANVVLRDQTLRPGISTTLKKSFKKIVSYKLTEDLNEIFICTNMSEKNEHFKANLWKATEAINSFFVKNNVREEVGVALFIDNLKINS